MSGRRVKSLRRLFQKIKGRWYFDKGEFRAFRKAHRRAA